MHLCFLSPEYPPETGWGGIGTYTYEMAHGLVALGHRVTVLSEAPGAAEERDDAGVRVIRVKPASVGGRVPGLWRLNRYLPRFAWAAARAFREVHAATPVDVVEASEFDAPSLFVHPMDERPPVVVRLHTPRVLIDLHNDNPQARYWMRRMYERRVVERAEALSAPSAAIVGAAFPAMRLAARPVTVLPNPIDTATFARPAIAMEPHTLLFAGRLETRKVGTLVEALPALFSANPDLRVRFVGNDGVRPDGERWSAYAARRVPPRFHDRLRFGRVPRTELPEIMAAAALAVFPSRWENFPYVLLEAMAAGTPAVVSAEGGMAEMVTDGKDGFILKENTPACLAVTVSRAMARPDVLRAMGRRATATIAARYDTSVVAPQMAAYYASVRGMTHA